MYNDVEKAAFIVLTRLPAKRHKLQGRKP